MNKKDPIGSFPFYSYLIEYDNMELAKLIDSTNLKVGVVASDIQKTCKEAKEYGFRAVCIHLEWTHFAKELLKNTDIKVNPVIDFPFGAAGHKVRIFAAKCAKKDGADELDVVMDMGNFKSGNYAQVLTDLKDIVKILPTKVIIETGLLSDREIKKASKLVRRSGAFCAKTSTGFIANTDIETKIKHVKIMKHTAGIKIKAAGGIKTMEDAEKLIRAGADIIGTSLALEMIKNF